MAPAGVKSPFAANAELLKQAPRRAKPQITELSKVKHGTKEMDGQMKALQNRIAFLQQQSGMADRSIEEAKRKTREVLTKRQQEERDKAERERQRAAAAEAEAASKAPLRGGDKAIGATVKPMGAVARAKAVGGTSTKVAGRAAEATRPKVQPGRAESRAGRPSSAAQLSPPTKAPTNGPPANGAAGSEDENLDPQTPTPTKPSNMPAATPPRTVEMHAQDVADKGNGEEHPGGAPATHKAEEEDVPNVKIAGSGWQSPEGMHPNLCIRDDGGASSLQQKDEKVKKDPKEKIVVSRISSKRPVSAGIKSVTETNKAFRSKYLEPREESDDDEGGVVVFETGAGKWA